MDTDDYNDFTVASSPINADAAAAWSVLTNDTGALFMGAEFETDWAVGQPITFRGEWKGSAYRDHGTIVTFREPHLLQFTQFSSMSGKEDTPENYDLVSFEFTDSDGGTLATMRLGKPKGVRAPAGDELAGSPPTSIRSSAVLKDLAEKS